MSVGPLMSSLEKCLFKSCPFFNCFFCLPGVELCEFFIYFGDQTLVLGIISKYVFPYSWFSFHFNDVLVHLHNVIVHRREKGGAPTLCNNMDGTGEYYAKRTKPRGERQIPYDLTFNWNIIIKRKKANNI